MADTPEKATTLTLPLAGPELVWRAELDRTVAELTFRRLKVACLVFLAGHLLAAAVYDLPAFHLQRWIARGAIIALLLLGLVFSRTRFASRHALGLSMVLGLLVIGHALASLPLYTTTGQDPTLITIILVTMGMLFPYTAAQMLVLCGATLLMGTGLVVILAGPISWFSLVNSAFYLLCTAIITAVSARLAWRLREAEVRSRLGLEEEQRRTEQLLLSILPASIAERLKRKKTLVAARHDQATVLFADLVGFTPLSEQLSPEALVLLLNDMFSRFDALAERFGLEKIKTIGDAYMAAAGLPEPRDDHAAAAARMALAMREAVADLRPPSGQPLNIRVGLHTGPVVAGVIGRNKFSYDLWGDTVNTASRMESHATPGVIQVSQQTRALLQADFDLEPRGEVEVKGKGPMQTWELVVERA